jgi:hypothetical protein
VIALGDPPRSLTRSTWIGVTFMDERPAGWYRDPDNARAHRYWDGQEWVSTQATPTECVEELETA